MLNSNKDENKKGYTFTRGIGTIWRFIASSIGFAFFSAVALLVVLIVMLVFAPDKVLNALEIIKSIA